MSEKVAKVAGDRRSSIAIGDEARDDQAEQGNEGEEFHVHSCL